MRSARADAKTPIVTNPHEQHGQDVGHDGLQLREACRSRAAADLRETAVPGSWYRVHAFMMGSNPHRSVFRVTSSCGLFTAQFRVTMQYMRLQEPRTHEHSDGAVRVFLNARLLE